MKNLRDKKKHKETLLTVVEGYTDGSRINKDFSLTIIVSTYKVALFIVFAKYFLCLEIYSQGWLILARDFFRDPFFCLLIHVQCELWILAGNFLSHVVNFGNFMAGNFLGGNFLGRIRRFDISRFSMFKWSCAMHLACRGLWGK